MEMCRDLPHTCGLDDNREVLVSSTTARVVAVPLQSPLNLVIKIGNLTPSHRKAFGLRISMSKT